MSMTIDLLEDLVPCREPANLEIPSQCDDGSFEVTCTDCGRSARVRPGRPFVHAEGCLNAA